MGGDPVASTGHTRRMRTRPLATALTLAALAALAACSGGNSHPAAATPATSYSPIFASAPPTQPAIATVDTPTTPPPRFPAGYPKIVNVTALPSQVKNWYQISGYTKAVALAPGVWTPLTPGATIDDAAASGPLDGYCASITAYERQYLGGEERGGACW